MTTLLSIRNNAARYGVTDSYQPMAFLLGDAKQLLSEAVWYNNQAEGHVGCDELHGCVYVYDVRTFITVQL